MPSDLRLVLEQQSIGIEGTGAGSGLEISFDRSEQGAVAAMTRLQGQAPKTSGPATACGAGVTRYSWGSGLEMLFRNGAFKGYQVRPGSGTPPMVTPQGAPVGGKNMDGRVFVAGLTCRS